MIQTFTFGYLPTKWKRLIRTPFTFWIGLLSFIIIDNGWSSANEEIIFKALLPSLGVFFTISYILKPFVVKDKD